MNRTSKALIVGAALAGLLAGTANRVQAASNTSFVVSKAGLQLAATSSDANDGKDKDKDKDKNNCKGKGGCKGTS